MRVSILAAAAVLIAFFAANQIFQKGATRRFFVHVVTTTTAVIATAMCVIWIGRAAHRDSAPTSFRETGALLLLLR